MQEDEVFAAGSGKVFAGKRAARRKPRTIRFSDAEWERIERLAVEQETSAAELVRQTLVAMTNGRLPVWFGAASAAELPAEIRIQIEQMYRGLYILATLKRDEMRREGRQDELDAVHEASRKMQQAIRENASGL